MPLALAMIHEYRGNYGISYPDFPGCISGGKSPEEAIRSGSEGLSFHVAGMVEDGEPLPMMRTLEQVREDPELREILEDAILALVPFDLPTKAVRVTISMDEHLLDAVDRAAKAAGQSRSAYLAEAARARMLKGAA